MCWTGLHTYEGSVSIFSLELSVQEPVNTPSITFQLLLLLLGFSLCIPNLVSSYLKKKNFLYKILVGFLDKAKLDMSLKYKKFRLKILEKLNVQ